MCDDPGWRNRSTTRAEKTHEEAFHKSPYSKDNTKEHQRFVKMIRMRYVQCVLEVGEVPCLKELYGSDYFW